MYKYLGSWKDDGWKLNRAEGTDLWYRENRRIRDDWELVSTGGLITRCGDMEIFTTAEESIGN